MASGSILDPFLQGGSSKSTRTLFRVVILGTIAAAAVSSRLFSVIRRSRLPDTHQRS